MMTSLTNGFSLSSAGAHDEAKGQRGGSKWQSSVCRPPGPGEVQEDAGAHMHCAGRWGWGEARPTEGRGILCSHFSSCVLFCLPAERKKKRKKKVLFHLVGAPRECNFQALSLSFLSFLLPTPPQGLSGTCNAQCVLAPVCLLGYFTKLASTVVPSKKREREREGRWLISCIWGNIKPYISRIHRGRRQNRKWAKPSEITWKKVRRIGCKWSFIQGFPTSNTVPWGSKEEYEGRF